jgi:hypothetical protein
MTILSTISQARLSAEEKMKVNLHFTMKEILVEPVRVVVHFG